MVPKDAMLVQGPNLALRLIRPEDADYVYALRSHPAYNRHLSEVRGTAEDQRLWIEAYKEREAKLSELYYVIERIDGTRCGVVRLYDIRSYDFTWGSWILDKNKTRKAALESAVLVYTVAFEVLALSKASFEVRRDNENTLAFHRRFGAKQTHESDQNVYFTYLRSRFEADRDGYLNLLEERPAK